MEIRSDVINMITDDYYLRGQLQVQAHAVAPLPGASAWGRWEGCFEQEVTRSENFAGRASHLAEKKLLLPPELSVFEPLYRDWIHDRVDFGFELKLQNDGRCRELNTVHFAQMLEHYGLAPNLSVGGFATVQSRGLESNTLNVIEADGLYLRPVWVSFDNHPEGALLPYYANMHEDLYGSKIPDISRFFKTFYHGLSTYIGELALNLDVPANPSIQKPSVVRLDVDNLLDDSSASFASQQDIEEYLDHVESGRMVKNSPVANFRHGFIFDPYAVIFIKRYGPALYAKGELENVLQSFVPLQENQVLSGFMYTDIDFDNPDYWSTN